MKERHNISHQFIARLLLVSLCLESCGGGFDNNPLIPIEKEPTTSIQAYTQEIIPQTNIQPLVDKTLTAQGGHIVTCYQEDGKLKANIEINAPQGFSKTYEGLSVAVEQGAELSNLPLLDKKAQQRRVHLQVSKGKEPAKVVIYKRPGLVGGMEGDDEEEPMDEEWIVQEGQGETIEEQGAEEEEDVSLEERNYSQLQTMLSERDKELPIFQKPLNPSKTLQGSQDIYEIEGNNKEKGERKNENEEVGENRKSYGALKRDPKAKANYTLGKLSYKEGKQEKAEKYFKKAEKAGDLKATQYLNRIQLQSKLNEPKLASELFTLIDKDNCDQIKSEIHAIDSNIKQNIKAKSINPELDTKRQELEEKLKNIQGVAKDVNTSDEWKKNATVPMVKSEDELKYLAERAVNTVYQKLNKSNNETDDNGSSFSSSSEAFSSQSFGIDKEIQPQVRTDKKIEEMNTFLSTIAHKNETSFTKTKQEELYEEINTFLSTIAHKNESSFTKTEQKELYNVSLFLQKEMEEISNIAYGEEKKPLIVLVGNTGAGKSTIAHWLTGKKMFSIRDFTIASNKQRDNKFHYIFSDTHNSTPDVPSKIAPGKKSKTTTPELWPAPEGWVYADCPGFNDTRGTLQKIKNALYIQALLKHHKRVKFLFVMPAGIFDSSVNRVKDVADALANLKNMFKDPYKLKNNISLVVTHHIAGFHKCIDTIKKDLKEFADVKKDEALKALLNDLAKNGVALFSRPLELGLYQNNEEEPESISSLTTHDQSLLEQNNEEKALVLESITSSNFLSLNFDEDVNPSIPDDAKLLLKKMSANLVERLKELLKTHIAEKIRIYFNEKIRNFKASVDALVDKCMQYYTPMALVFGPSKKAKEDLEETLNKNAISHNEKPVPLQLSSSWIAGAQLTSGVIGPLLQTTGGLLTAS
ncbi:MAG: tetratricopeptide repeat protein, partial [Candidatus Amoebophilus sp.]